MLLHEDNTSKILLSYRLSLCRSVSASLFVCLVLHSFSFNLSMFSRHYLFGTHICIFLMGSQWHLSYFICPSLAPLVLIFTVSVLKAQMITGGSQEMKNNKDEQKERERERISRNTIVDKR